MIFVYLHSKNSNHKKVLLRECKRHTARRVVSTHSVVQSWLTPPPHWLDWSPQLDWPPPPGWTDLTPPPAGLTWPPPAGLTWPPPQAGLTWSPPGWTDLTPPPGLTDLTPPPVDRQTPVKTVPSRHTMYAGGKNLQNIYFLVIHLGSGSRNSMWMRQNTWNLCDYLWQPTFYRLHM